MAYEIFVFSLVIAKVIRCIIYGKQNVRNVVPSVVHVLKLERCSDEVLAFMASVQR